MSGALMGAVFGLELSPSERLVLLAYADHANDDGGSVRPSHARIAWKTDLSERRVREITQKLIDDGILVRVRHSGPRQPNEYRIDLDAGRRKPPFVVPASDRTAAEAIAGVPDRTAAEAIAGVPDRTAAEAIAGVPPNSGGFGGEQRRFGGGTAAEAIATKPSYINRQTEPPKELLTQPWDLWEKIWPRLTASNAVLRPWLSSATADLCGNSVVVRVPAGGAHVCAGAGLPDSIARLAARLGGPEVGVAVTVAS
jgi:hypothetical protein